LKQTSGDLPKAFSKAIDIPPAPANPSTIFGNPDLTVGR